MNLNAEQTSWSGKFAERSAKYDALSLRNKRHLGRTGKFNAWFTFYKQQQEIKVWQPEHSKDYKEQQTSLIHGLKSLLSQENSVSLGNKERETMNQANKSPWN